MSSSKNSKAARETTTIKGENMRGREVAMTFEVLSRFGAHSGRNADYPHKLKGKVNGKTWYGYYGPTRMSVYAVTGGRTRTLLQMAAPVEAI